MRDEHAEGDGSRDKRDVVQQPEDAVERRLDPRLLMTNLRGGIAAEKGICLLKPSRLTEAHSRQGAQSPRCDPTPRMNDHSDGAPPLSSTATDGICTK